jgi:predicted ArsR family transcriptional regulator
MKDLLGDTPYPHAPGYKERGCTSEAAAHAIEHEAKTLRADVLFALKQHPMTADEVAARLRRSILSIRPRLSELRSHGKIVPTGVLRANASGKKAKEWRAA